MSNYTKGPWTLKHISGSNFATQRFEIRGMFGERPGVYPIFNKDTNAIDGATICCSPGDAALIAAAPELLEALETIGVHTITDEDGDEVEVLFGDIDKICAAIAKARGES